MFVYIPYLAEVLGYAVAAKVVDSYVRGKAPSIRSSFASVKEAMQNGGFTGEQTPVYEDRSGGFVYAVENEDKVDACLAFFQPDKYTTMVEGPSIVAMYTGAQDVQRQRSQEVARQLFAPKEQITQNLGRLNSETGYSKSTRYKNLSDGFVDINYTRTSNNTGLITVHSESGPGLQSHPQESLTYDKELQFSFPTTQV